MSGRQSLYEKALLAWRRELVARHDSTLKDKGTKMRYALRQKLVDMFGSEYPIEMEDAHAKEKMVLGAVIENLNFLAFRRSAGDIHIVLMMPCSRCGYQMPSESLTCLADLGRELLKFEMSGTLRDHECPNGPLG